MSRGLYFAYGSNMWLAQMRDRCPGSEVVGVGRLLGHRLAFTRFSKKRSSTVADVVGAPERDVWGAVYRVTSSDLDQLDRDEGVSFGAYRRDQVEIVLAEGGVQVAWTYTVVNKQPERPPARSYQSILVRGARDHGLPVEYIEQLEALECCPDLGR